MFLKLIQERLPSSKKVKRWWSLPFFLFYLPNWLLLRYKQWRNNVFTQISTDSLLQQTLLQIYSYIIHCIKVVNGKYRFGEKKVSINVCIKSARLCSNSFYTSKFHLNSVMCCSHLSPKMQTSINFKRYLLCFAWKSLQQAIKGIKLSNLGLQIANCFYIFHIKNNTSSIFSTINNPYVPKYNYY